MHKQSHKTEAWVLQKQKNRAESSTSVEEGMDLGHVEFNSSKKSFDP